MVTVGGFVAMLLVMLRNGSVHQINHCTDVVHKAGHLACLNARGAIIASYRDDELLYYTLDPKSVQTIQRLKQAAADSRPEQQPPKRQLAQSVLERLWRLRKRREVGRIHPDQM
jgi:hypothetical protein